MLNLTFIKRLSSPGKAIMALYFGGLDLTGLDYPRLSMPEDSLLGLIRDRQDSYHKCRHSASGGISSLGGRILQIEPSLVIATVTALFRTLNENFFFFSLAPKSTLFGLRWELPSSLPPAYGEPSAQPQSLWALPPHLPFFYHLSPVLCL